MGSRLSHPRQLERITNAFLRVRPGAHWAELEALRLCVGVWLDKVDLPCLEAAAEDLALRAHRLTPNAVDGYIAFRAARGYCAVRGR